MICMAIVVGQGDLVSFKYIYTSMDIVFQVSIASNHVMDPTLCLFVTYVTNIYQVDN